MSDELLRHDRAVVIGRGAALPEGSHGAELQSGCHATSPMIPVILDTGVMVLICSACQAVVYEIPLTDALGVAVYHRRPAGMAPDLCERHTAAPTTTTTLSPSSVQTVYVPDPDDFDLDPEADA